MKKRYIKPKILVEDFILSSSVAGSCDNSGQAFQNDCPQNYSLEAVIYALDTMDGVEDGKVEGMEIGTEIPLPVEGQTVQVCYHTSQGISIFTS